MKDAEAFWRRLLVDASLRVQSVTDSIANSRERTKVLGIGASGDKTLAADKAAEDELLTALAEAKGLAILSEEAGRLGDAKADQLVILDPLDGSANFEREIPFYCTSAAVVEGRQIDDVKFGIVRNLVSGDVYWAAKGKGATKNGRRIRTSKGTEPSDSVVDIDLSRSSPALVSRLGPLIGAVRRQVHYGANALELCFLAEGRLDAFVDLREKMRITDFAAAYLIAKESGAEITKGDGSLPAPSMDLEGRFSFIAASNRILHHRILDLCKVQPNGRVA